MTKDFLSKEDRALFRKALAGVVPLHTHNKLKAELLPKPLPIPNKKAPIALPEKEARLSDYYVNEVSAESILSYGEQNLPNKRMRQLKKGQISLEARTDLHGLRAETARQSLWNFIELNYQAGKRCVLIIHGKGSLRAEAPVLKNLVNHWLRQLPCVLAFHSALPRDGGSGALYVLLKKHP